MNTNNIARRARINLAAGIASLLLLGGCATLSPDAGFGSVKSMTAERLNKEVNWARTEAEKLALRDQVHDLLARPLTADVAVQIALLNNPTLQATYSELGIAEADLVQAGRLHNPGFSFARLERGGEFEYERKFIFEVFGLLTMPTRTRTVAPSPRSRRFCARSRRSASSRPSSRSLRKSCALLRKPGAPISMPWPRSRARTIWTRPEPRPKPAPNWPRAWRGSATGASSTRRASRRSMWRCSRRVRRSRLPRLPHTKTSLG